jgi:hypothetical protein
MVLGAPASKWQEISEHFRARHYFASVWFGGYLPFLPRTVPLEELRVLAQIAIWMQQFLDVNISAHWLKTVWPLYLLDLNPQGYAVSGAYYRGRWIPLPIQPRTLSEANHSAVMGSPKLRHGLTDLPCIRDALGESCRLYQRLYRLDLKISMCLLKPVSVLWVET